MKEENSSQSEKLTESSILFPQNKTNISKNLIKWGIIPKYTEIYLFLISVTFLLILFTNLDFRKEILLPIFDIVFHPHNLSDSYFIFIIFSFFAFILFSFAIISSIYSVFTERNKTYIEKNIMLVFAFVVNVVVAGCILNKTEGYLAIFPLWNLLSIIFLCMLFRGGVINNESIFDIKPKNQEILISFIAVVFIFFLSQYVLKNYWAITASICICYATTIDAIVNRFLFKKVSTF